ncbi:HAD-IIB family hydrolase [Candidatus Dojkabacteria bacterium]|nr:HAD-IIB family hydrolase [Candidatus Dojkabacteria bacterium]
MIKAAILDVDGVIVGTKENINAPYPHPDVMKKLKEVQDSGIPIVLCTGKAQFSINPVVKEANLDNLHIVNGGAVILDPINDIVEEKHLLDKDLLKRLIKLSEDDDQYLELYTLDSWYVRKGQNDKYRDQHAAILDQEAKEVDSLQELVDEDVVKAILVVHNSEEEERYKGVFEEISEEMDIGSTTWTCAPIMLPARFLIFTAKGVSKSTSSKKVAESLDISMDEMLGVGDNASDWKFMQHCGYVAAMGNGKDGLQEIVKQKEDHFIAPDVDDNGILEVFEHFEDFFAQEEDCIGRFGNMRKRLPKSSSEQIMNAVERGRK